MKTGHTLRVKHTKRLPPNTEMQNLMIKCDFHGYLDLESELDHQTMDKRIKAQNRDEQNEAMMQTDKHICRRAYQYHLKAYCSTKEMPPVAMAS